MRVRTVQLDDRQLACVALPDGRLARADRVLAGAPCDLLSLLQAEQLDALLYRLGERVELLGVQKRQQVARRAGQDAVGAGEAAVRECDAG